MLQVTQEIRSKFYNYVYQLAESECQQVVEECPDTDSYTEDDIEDTLRNIIDDDHPLLYDLANDVYEDILGRELTDDEYDWFINEGIYIEL